MTTGAVGQWRRGRIKREELYKKGKCGTCRVNPCQLERRTCTSCLKKCKKNRAHN